MRHLHRISWLVTLLGIGIILAAWVADLDPVWLLAGILLAWAGLVKIVVVLIWTRVALMGTDEHRPTPSP
jgi:hypothetical protein